jgi:hypothetical protein
MTMQDWTAMRDEYLRRLEEQTGKSVADWNKAIAKQRFKGHQELNAWLEQQGVTGYPAMFLGFETFGYPDYMTKDGSTLIEEQYADRPELRPILNALLERITSMGEMTVIARKGFVALATKRRTFARIKPTTKKRVDVGLRLDGQSPTGLLKPSRIEPNMKVQLEAMSVDDLTDEFFEWVRKAYLHSS